MTRQLVVTCTGCGETWEAPPGMIGALCGKGQVREATPTETAQYVAQDVEPEPYEDTYFPGVADYDRFGRPSWET